MKITKENKYYVYFHINKQNGKVFYIGKGCNDRAFQKRSRNEYWHNTVNKYGYEINIVSDNLTNDEAGLLEIQLISFYGMNNLCNLTSGGDGCHEISQIVKDKISNTLKGKIQSEETRKKRSISSKKTWGNPLLRELKRKQSKELNKLGIIGSKGKPSKKKGKPFQGDKTKISNSLKEYYKHNDVWNKINLPKNEIDFILNHYYLHNNILKLSKEINKSRNFVKRILTENGNFTTS